MSVTAVKAESDIEVSMVKIVVWKSPKALSCLLRLFLGIKKEA